LQFPIPKRLAKSGGGLASVGLGAARHLFTVLPVGFLGTERKKENNHPKNSRKNHRNPKKKNNYFLTKRPHKSDDGLWRKYPPWAQREQGYQHSQIPNKTRQNDVSKGVGGGKETTVFGPGPFPQQPAKKKKKRPPPAPRKNPHLPRNTRVGGKNPPHPRGEPQGSGWETKLV